MSHTRLAAYIKNYETEMHSVGAPEDAFKTFRHMSNWCMNDIGYIAPEVMDERIVRNMIILHRAVCEGSNDPWTVGLRSQIDCIYI